MFTRHWFLSSYMQEASTWTSMHNRAVSPGHSLLANTQWGHIKGEPDARVAKYVAFGHEV